MRPRHTFARQGRGRSLARSNRTAVLCWAPHPCRTGPVPPHRPVALAPTAAPALLCLTWPFRRRHLSLRLRSGSIAGGGLGLPIGMSPCIAIAIACAGVGSPQHRVRDFAGVRVARGQVPRLAPLRSAAGQATKSGV